MRCRSRPRSTRHGCSRAQSLSSVAVVDVGYKLDDEIERRIEDLVGEGVDTPPIASCAGYQPAVELIRDSQQ